MDAEKTGKLIKQMRAEKKMTQQAFAEKIHVTATAISKWENGHSLPDIGALEDIASALDISLVELITGERICPLENENIAANTDTDVVLKSVIKESIVQRNRKAFKAVAITILAAAILIAGWYFLAIHGFSARQADIMESHMLTRDIENDCTLWEVRFSSVDGHGIRVRRELVESESTVYLYVYRSILKSSTSDTFNWGISASDNSVGVPTYSKVTIIYRDTAVTYSLVDEGLFN